MIVADTSVWIEFLRGDPRFVPQVTELLERRQILGVECVFGELLQGAKATRETRIITDYWHHLPHARLEEALILAGSYSQQNSLVSRGVGLIDAVIVVTAIHAQALVWTLDRKLRAVLPLSVVYGP